MLLLTQAAAAANQESSVEPERAAKPAQTAPKTMEDQLAYKRQVARKYRGTIRFFESHRWLLSSADHRATASTALRRAKRNLARVNRNITAIQSVLAKRTARRQASMSPRAVICDVFGRYCDQAVAVAWCESRLTTTAQNGQYLGLFQMGSNERRLFGHGGSVRKQAKAAHRYFVESGRDWSPWSCKPGYAY